MKGNSIKDSLFSQTEQSGFLLLHLTRPGTVFGGKLEGGGKDNFFSVAKARY